MGSVNCRARPERSQIRSPSGGQRIILLTVKLIASEVTAEMNKDRKRHISVSTIKRRLIPTNFDGCIAINVIAVPWKQRKRLKRVHNIATGE